MKACFKWAQVAAQDYLDNAEQSYESCDYWDQGCTGLPRWVCTPLGWLCVASTFVFGVLFLLCAAASIAVCAVWTIVQVIGTPLAWLGRLILSLPVAGRLTNSALNVIEDIFWRLAGSGGFLLDVVGIRAIKKARLCVIILSDYDGPATTRAALVPHIDRLRTTLRDEANVHLFLDPIRSSTMLAPSCAPDIVTKAGACVDDLWLVGSYFELIATRFCAGDATSRVLGYGSPILVFVVPTVSRSAPVCAPCPSGYLTIEGSNLDRLSHAVAHKLGLSHHGPPTNLAHDGGSGRQMVAWQRTILRNSKHVTYA